MARQQSERQRDATRSADHEYRGWYKLKRWQDLRQEVLVRDLFTCRQTGVLLIGKAPAPNSPVVDHITPHRGDPALFWDIDNLQSVSKAWHDSVKQARERADQTASIHPRWLTPSQVPLTIVCGPACAGKTTYVAQHAGPRDLVIDLDVIAVGISGEPLHGWDRDRWLNAALWQRNNMLGDLCRGGDWPHAWLIVSEPKARHRDWWQQTLRPVEIVVLEVPERECCARIGQDRDEARTRAVIERWWVDYERRIGDRRVTGP